MKTSLQRYGAFLAVTSAALLGAATAQASSVDLALARRGADTTHATRTFTRHAADLEFAGAPLWPRFVFIAAGDAALRDDPAARLHDAPHADAAFD